MAGEYRPVTDAEWNWLTRRFVALARRPGMRQLFNNSLKGSPYTEAERRRFRREIFDNVRELAAPTEAYPNPYFELTWFRAVQVDPTLADPERLAHNRAVLYDAFYRRPEPQAVRDARIAEWNRITAGEDIVLETVTDGEELEVTE